MQRGILCHNRARALRARSIAAEEIQDRRRPKRIPQGPLLHDCANLYFNPRNPMMYRRQNLHAELCILCVDPNVIDLPNVVITDQNAASGWARFAPAPAALEIVEYERTFAQDWTNHDDQREAWRHKSQMCAEVLVPQRVDQGLILGAYVSCEAAENELAGSGFVLTIEIRPSQFFR